MIMRRAKSHNMCVPTRGRAIPEGVHQLVVWIVDAAPGAQFAVSTFGMDFATLIDVAYTRGRSLPVRQCRLERDIVQHIQWYSADDPRCSKSLVGGYDGDLTVVPNMRDTTVEDVGEVSCG